jgi:hypothetical protein
MLWGVSCRQSVGGNTSRVEFFFPKRELLVLWTCKTPATAAQYVAFIAQCVHYSCGGSPTKQPRMADTDVISVPLQLPLSPSPNTGNAGHTDGNHGDRKSRSPAVDTCMQAGACTQYARAHMRTHHLPSPPTRNHTTQTHQRTDARIGPRRCTCMHACAHTHAHHTHQTHRRTHARTCPRACTCTQVHTHAHACAPQTHVRVLGGQCTCDWEKDAREGRELPQSHQENGVRHQNPSHSGWLPVMARYGNRCCPTPPMTDMWWGKR